MKLGIWAAPLLALCASTAFSAPLAYTARELKPPFGYSAKNCAFSRWTILSEAGEVITACTYTAGWAAYTPSNAPFGVQPFMPFQIFGQRPVVWRADGSAVAWTLPSCRNLSSIWGSDAKGRALLQTGQLGLDRCRNSISPAPDWWQNGKRVGPTPPISEFGNYWRAGNITGSGKFAAHAIIRGSRQIMIVDGATTQSLPLPPELAELDRANPYSDYSAPIMNDAGQIALVTRIPGTGSATQQAPYRAWFWNGQNWSDIKADTRDFGYDIQVLGVSPAGRVLIRSTTYGNKPLPRKELIWWSNTGVEVVPPEVFECGDTCVMAAEGDVAGLHVFPNNPLPGASGPVVHAAVIHEGQAVNLNTLVAPPANFAFTTVLAANRKGQLLVEMYNTDQKTPRKRIWLFTPK